MSDFNLIILCLEILKSMPCVLDLKKKSFPQLLKIKYSFTQEDFKDPENNRIKIKVYFHANNLKIAGQLVHNTHFPGTIQRSPRIYPLSPNSLHFKNIPDNPFPPDCVGSERSVVPTCLAVSLGSPVSSALCLTLKHQWCPYWNHHHLLLSCQLHPHGVTYALSSNFLS